MNIVESFVGGGRLVATGEPRRRCAVIYAFLRQFSSGFRGTTGRKGGGGVSSENGARARLQTWLEIQRPRGLPARVRISHSSTLPPFPWSGLLRAPD